MKLIDAPFAIPSFSPCSENPANVPITCDHFQVQMNAPVDMHKHQSVHCAHVCHVHCHRSNLRAPGTSRPCLDQRNNIDPPARIELRHPTFLSIAESNAKASVSN